MEGTGETPVGTRLVDGTPEGFLLRTVMGHLEVESVIDGKEVGDVLVDGNSLGSNVGLSDREGAAEGNVVGVLDGEEDD